MADRAFTKHMRAADVNPTWLGWRFTARNRADARLVTGGLSDIDRDPKTQTTYLFMGGHVVELRDDDTVTVTGGELDVLGGGPAA